MVEVCWDEYRGWAKRSRAIQIQRRHWNLAALSCTLLAAVLGASADVFGEGAIARALSALAAVMAVTTPVLGRYVIDVAGDAAWIRARATAEALKSECYRFAAQVGAYGQPDALDTFVMRRNALVEQAIKAGLTPLQDAVEPTADARRPPAGMDTAWYLANRVIEQARYYGTHQAVVERELGRWRVAALVTSLLSATLAALASSLQVAGFAPWIAVLTTLGALVVAQSALERRQSLAVSDAAMARALRQIAERRAPDLAALVDNTERLLDSEHQAWIVSMTTTIAPSAGMESKPADIVVRSGDR